MCEPGVCWPAEKRVSLELSPNHYDTRAIELKHNCHWWSWCAVTELLISHSLSLSLLVHWTSADWRSWMELRWLDDNMWWKIRSMCEHDAHIPGKQLMDYFSTRSLKKANSGVRPHRIWLSALCVLSPKRVIRTCELHLHPSVLILMIIMRTVDTSSTSGWPCQLLQISRAVLWGFFVTVEWALC